MYLDTLETIYKEKDIRNNNYRYCTVAPNGVFVATLARLGSTFELTVLKRDVALMKVDAAECHQICPGFKGTRQYTEQVECKFSPDSAYIAVSCSLGFLFVVKRKLLQEHCLVIPGIIDLDESRLSNARCFDFDPRYFHKLLCFCTVDNFVYVCNIDTQEIFMTIGVETEGGIDCIGYNHYGTLLAVATSEAMINMYCPDTGDLLYSLDGAHQGDEVSMKLKNGVYPTVCRMSFSQSGQQLAVSATDGLIRVWQLRPQMDLQHMCRLAVLKVVPANRVEELPLPTKLIAYLLNWPMEWGDFFQYLYLDSLHGL